MAEHAILNDGCVLISLPNRTHIELRGSDRASFVHNLCTNDIKRLQPGQGCEAFITDVRGKTIGHVLAFLGTENLTLEAVPNQSEILMQHLDKYLITEDVQLLDQTDEKTEIALLGAAATATLNQAGLSAPAESYEHDDCDLGTLGGKTVSVRRVAMTSTPVFLLQSTAADVFVVEKALSAAGAVSADEPFLDTARIEFGWPVFGQDITASNLPQELNRDAAAISFTKGCYLGQETVARIDALGHVNRLLVGIRFEGEQVPTLGSALSVAGKEVGNVTSVTFSPRLSAPLALGFVRTEHAGSGTRLECDGTKGEVVAMPAE